MASRLDKLRTGINKVLGLEPSPVVQGEPPSEPTCPAPDDITAHRLTEDNSGSQGMPEDEGDAIAYPVLGALHPPRKHALTLIASLLRSGAQGKSFSVRDLGKFHLEMCLELGWAWRKWPAIGRELRALGLETATVPVGGERLTYYQIAPATQPTATVVELAAAERRRA